MGCEDRREEVGPVGVIHTDCKAGAADDATARVRVNQWHDLLCGSFTPGGEAAAKLSIRAGVYAAHRASRRVRVGGEGGVPGQGLRRAAGDGATAGDALRARIQRKVLREDRAVEVRLLRGRRV